MLDIFADPEIWRADEASGGHDRLQLFHERLERGHVAEAMGDAHVIGVFDAAVDAGRDDPVLFSEPIGPVIDEFPGIVIVDGVLDDKSGHAGNLTGGIKPAREYPFVARRLGQRLRIRAPLT